MIGYDNTISEHDLIKHKTFDFLVDLTFQLEGKTGWICGVSVVDLIDFIEELEKCNEYQNQLGGAKHIKSLDRLRKIVDRLTAGEACGKMKVDELLHDWMRDDADLEYCRRQIKHYI
jgi:hypothetical protein